MSFTYFAWLNATLIVLVDKAKPKGPPWVRWCVGVSLMAFLATDAGGTAGLGAHGGQNM